MESVGPGRPRSPPRSRRHAPSLRTCGVGQVDVDRAGDRRDHRRPVGRIRFDRTGDRRPDPRSVVRFAGHRLVGEPAARAARSAPRVRADPLSANARAPDLGVLRDVRRPRRPMAAAGQPAGASDRGGRAPHVADEHGTLAACESHRLRFRLHPGRPALAAHGERHGHDGDPGAIRGPFLQLVRHAVGQAVAASVCLVGGQRQSRRSPDDVAARTRGACRRQDHRAALVRRLDRHAARSRGRHRRNRAGAARATATGSGDRLRLAAREHRGGAGVARAARDGCRRGRGVRRQDPGRRFGERNRGRERIGILGGCPRPPMPDPPGRARIPRSVERPADRAGRVERLAGPARDPDVARARGARGAIASRDRTGRARGRVARGSRGAGRSLPGRHRSESSRRAADGGNRAPRAAMRCARPNGVRLSLRSGAASAGHRLQRRRAPARRELLRSARLRGAIREFRGDRAGTAAAGELVRARAPAHVVRGPASPSVVERLDVRVPDAAPRDAHVREHAARPDGSRFGRRARSRTGSCAACPGAFRNAATTPSTQASTTSTARSASRASD